jgi:hypothetical protein
VIKIFINSKGGTKDCVVDFVISGDYLKLRIDTDVTSLTIVKATFPLTLWISLGCGLCRNIFHSMIYTSHIPICGTLLRIGEKKKVEFKHCAIQFVYKTLQLLTIMKAIFIPI